MGSRLPHQALKRSARKALEHLLDLPEDKSPVRTPVEVTATTFPEALMRDDPMVIELVRRAQDGEQRAWDEIVERFAPLLWGICRRFRLSDADAHDVGQNGGCVSWSTCRSCASRLRCPAGSPPDEARVHARATFELGPRAGADRTGRGAASREEATQVDRGCSPTNAIR